MLQLNHVSYRSGNHNLLTDIQLSFESGKLYGILGPNGAGKSTLLKTLAGLWKPTSGLVLWQGHPLHRLGRQQISQIVSVVPQSLPIAFEFTVEEMVVMGRYPHVRGAAEPRSAKLVQWALEMVDAWHLHKRLINELSHGERQRVYIARALVVESPILLLDEPTASLDIRHQMEVWDLLHHLREQGKLVIVAIHDLNACAHNCDEVVLLHEGKCVARGPVTECLTPAHLFEVFQIEIDPYVGVTKRPIKSTSSRYPYRASPRCDSPLYRP